MDEAEYYARREGEERELAEASDDPKGRAIHLALAEKYAELAQRDWRSTDVWPMKPDE